MKVKVIIEEILNKSFEIEVPDFVHDKMEFAMDIAKEKYKNGEFILDGDACVTNKQMMSEINDKSTEWISF